MSLDISKYAWLVIILVILASVVASSSIGYLLGSNYPQNGPVSLNQTKTVTDTVTETSGPSPSGPGLLAPDPYEYSVAFEGTSELWYVPIVFFAPGTAGELYVNYNCGVRCPENYSSISSMDLTEELPQAFSISENGELAQSAGVNFSVGPVVEVQNTSETILYDVSISAPGYYTFSLPFGCTPEPIVYAKTAGSNSNYTLIMDWAKSLVTSGMNCSDVMQVTILGFTNSNYTDIQVAV